MTKPRYAMFLGANSSFSCRLNGLSFQASKASLEKLSRIDGAGLM